MLDIFSITQAYLNIYLKNIRLKIYETEITKTIQSQHSEHYQFPNAANNLSSY